MLTKADLDRLWNLPLVPTPIHFPVVVAGTQEEIAGWIFTPPIIRPEAPAIVVDLYPGATYCKDYWHLTGPAFPGKSYSFAQYLVEQIGAIVVACDHLGTGESSRPPDGRTVTLKRMAEARALVARQIRERLGNGTLLPEIPALPQIRLDGIGHSAGAAILTHLQGGEALYDAVGILGWSQQALFLPGVDQATAAAALAPDARGYIPSTQRAAMRPFFYGSFVAPDLMEADERLATALPTGSAPLFMTPGVTAEAAAAITAPVYLAFGEVDCSPDPHAEVACYPQARDVTLYILPGSAHAHNLAPTRQHLWHQIALWLRRVAQAHLLAEAA